MKAHLRHNWLVYLALILLTLAVFSRVTTFEFINYDDWHYVIDNPNIKAGINAQSLVWAFTKPYDANWMPMVWISFMIDHETGGAIPHTLYNRPSENPAPYHRTNLIIHVLNVLLLFGLLLALTKDRWRSAFVAALFAIHPLHVQSVAWVAERKDMLSTFFMLLTLLAYLWYWRKPGIARYLLMAFAFALGLMSKSMLVTLPALLLLLDFWPLQRTQKRKTLALIAEKLPLLAMVVPVAIITVAQQREAHSIYSLSAYSLPVRFDNALVSLVWYLQKMAWPSKLAFYYPHPGSSIPTLWIIASGIILATITLGAARLAKPRPYLIFGWLWYLITLLPVIGLLQIGDQGMADRYTYVPLIGVFIALAWMIPDALRKSSPAPRLLAALACLAVLALAVRSYCEVGYWQNDNTIFSRAIEVNSHSTLPHYNLATALTFEGELEEAVGHYHAIIRINPKAVTAHIRLATLLDRLGRTKEAAKEYKETLRLRPSQWDEANNLAMILAADADPSRRDSKNALVLARRACEATHYLRPEVVDTLGVAYAANGQFDLAIATAEQATKLAESQNNTSMARQIAEEIKLYKSRRPYISPPNQRW